VVEDAERAKRGWARRDEQRYPADANPAANEQLVSPVNLPAPAGSHKGLSQWLRIGQLRTAAVRQTAGSRQASGPFQTAQRRPVPSKPGRGNARKHRALCCSRIFACCLAAVYIPSERQHLRLGDAGARNHESLLTFLAIKHSQHKRFLTLRNAPPAHAP
jgi:hypothetical protein